LVAAGFAWTTTTSTFNVGVQLSVPAWVQARALGTYQMVFQGGMALGSAFWGYVAEHSSVSRSLLCAALGLLISLPLTRRLHILRGTPPDLSPYSLNRPAPEVVIEPRPQDGPVLIMIEYRIQPSDYEEFSRLIHAMRAVRLRDGAIRWGVYRDAADPTRITENFVVESWIEYLRQRERLTTADRRIRDRLAALHDAESGPRASHMIYVREVEPNHSTLQ
jgi:quinol monooxygenase YgiN